MFISEAWEGAREKPKQPEIDWQNFCNRLSNDNLTKLLECARKARLAHDVKRAEANQICDEKI